MSIELTAWKLMLGEEKIHLDQILPVRSRRGNSKDRFNSALMRTYLLGTTNQNKKDNTHNLHDLFAANHTIQVRHLIPNDIGRIGKNYAADGNGEDEADKIAKKFMEKRHTMFLNELKAHLTKLKKSVKS